MKREILFNELQIAYNDEFQAMSREELNRYFRDNLERWGIRYPEHHMMVSVSKKDAGLFTGLLTDAKSILRGAERCNKRFLRDYCRIDEAPVWIDGQQAERLRFSYTADDSAGKSLNIRQNCELIVIKLRRRVYALHFLYRNDNINEAKAQFDVILQSLRFSP